MFLREACLTPCSRPPKRAWGMPGAQCTRSLACESETKHTSVVTTGPPEKPGIPARGWFYGLLRALPGEPGFFATVAGGIASTNLTPASGCQDHTTSPSESRHARQLRATRVHRIPFRVS